MSVTHSEILKHTPLYDCHVAWGGKMVDFGGYALPLFYSSIMQEHEWVRSACGVFDVSHLGEFHVSGDGAFNYLQNLIPTDLEKITDFQMLYTVLLNEEGGILDDIVIYRTSAKDFYLVVNASRIDKVLEHLKTTATPRVSLSNHSGKVACIAVQGPKAVSVCEKLIAKGLSELGYYHFKTVSRGDKKIWVSRSGYTGEDGFELFSEPEAAPDLWNTLVKEGKALGVLPVGLGARNTLRLEAGNNLYGVDMDESRTPFEARLGWLISKSKSDFVGKQKLFERKNSGLQGSLCGFRMKDKSVPRDGYVIYKEGKKIGDVTSGSYSPTLKIGIGLGYVAESFKKPGALFDIQIHGHFAAAEVVKLPFVPLRHL